MRLYAFWGSATRAWGWRKKEGEGEGEGERGRQWKAGEGRGRHGKGTGKQGKEWEGEGKEGKEEEDRRRKLRFRPGLVLPHMGSQDVACAESGYRNVGMYRSTVGSGGRVYGDEVLSCREKWGSGWGWVGFLGCLGGCLKWWGVGDMLC